MKRGKGKPQVLLAGLFCLCLFLLVGCGEVELPEEVNQQTLAVTKEGNVILWLTGVFDQTYYRVDELETMVKEEAIQFNQKFFSRSLTATVESVAMAADNSQVIVRLRFNNPEAYTAYSEKELYYGTVEEAVLSGYHLGGKTVSVKKGSVLEEDQLEKQKEKHIIITEEDVRIYGPYEPQYVNSSAAVNKDGSVDPGDTGESTYIIMK